jgi:hypothetical protein
MLNTLKSQKANISIALCFAILSSTFSFTLSLTSLFDIDDCSGVDARDVITRVDGHGYEVIYLLVQ